MSVSGSIGVRENRVNDENRFNRVNGENLVNGRKGEERGFPVSYRCTPAQPCAPSQTRRRHECWRVAEAQRIPFTAPKRFDSRPFFSNDRL